MRRVGGREPRAALRVPRIEEGPRPLRYAPSRGKLTDSNGEALRIITQTAHEPRVGCESLDHLLRHGFADEGGPARDAHIAKASQGVEQVHSSKSFS